MNIYNITNGHGWERGLGIVLLLISIKMIRMGRKWEREEQ